MLKKYREGNKVREVKEIIEKGKERREVDGGSREMKHLFSLIEN